MRGLADDVQVIPGPTGTRATIRKALAGNARPAR
jgi:hypothetical protein